MRPGLLTALVTVTAVLTLVACGDQRQVEPSPAAVERGGWVRLPDPPLPARDGSVVAHVGDEVVVVGGYDGPTCPPGAACVYPGDRVRRDGAAYDLSTRTWRSIAAAPRPVPELASRAVLGPTLFALAGGVLLSWDSSTDVWSEREVPGTAGGRAAGGALVVDGDRLVVASSTDENGVVPDRVLDPATDRWSTLPADPLRPAFDRIVVSTPAGLVLTGKAIDPAGGPADPALVRAAILEPGAEAWRILPASEQLGGWRWSWTGRRLVDVSLGGNDGGEVDNYGRVLPYGGRLDPGSGTWSSLPDAPAERSGGWPVEAPGGPLVAAEGWVYDDATGSWTRLPQPTDGPSEPGPAVWADGLLVVIGGSDRTDGGLSDVATGDERSSGAWSYRPD